MLNQKSIVDDTDAISARMRELEAGPTAGLYVLAKYSESDTGMQALTDMIYEHIKIVASRYFPVIEFVEPPDIIAWNRESWLRTTYEYEWHEEPELLRGMDGSTVWSR